MEPLLFVGPLEDNVEESSGYRKQLIEVELGRVLCLCRPISSATLRPIHQSPSASPTAQACSADLMFNDQRLARRIAGSLPPRGILPFDASVSLSGSPIPKTIVSPGVTHHQTWPALICR